MDKTTFNGSYKISKSNIKQYKNILEEIDILNKNNILICYNGKGYNKNNSLLNHVEIFNTLKENVFLHNTFSTNERVEDLTELKNDINTKNVFLIVHYIYPNKGDYLNIKKCNLSDYFNVDKEIILFEYVSKYNSKHDFLEKIKKINAEYFKEYFKKYLKNKYNLE